LPATAGVFGYFAAANIDAFSLSRAYTSLSRGCTSLSRGYTSFSRSYTSLSRGYTSLSWGYTSLSRGYTSLSRGYAVRSAFHAASVRPFVLSLRTHTVAYIMGSLRTAGFTERLTIPCTVDVIQYMERASLSMQYVAIYLLQAFR